MPLVASRLRFALRWSGMSQAALARVAGINPQRITDLVAGRRAPDRYIGSIASALRVTPEWLLGSADTPNPDGQDPPPPAATDQEGFRSAAAIRQHPMSPLLRPVDACLHLRSWGEVLVLWRLMRAARSTQGLHALDHDVVEHLMQRLCTEVGLDADSLAAGAKSIDSLSG